MVVGRIFRPQKTQPDDPRTGAYWQILKCRSGPTCDPKIGKAGIPPRFPISLCQDRHSRLGSVSETFMTTLSNSPYPAHLLGFIAFLEKEHPEQVVRITKEVDPKFGVSGIQIGRASCRERV